MSFAHNASICLKCPAGRSRRENGLHVCVESGNEIRQHAEAGTCPLGFHVPVADPPTWVPQQPSRGLGDSIAKITSSVGIKPCDGCKGRQTILNRLFPYKPPSLESLLTIGVTAFLRPKALARFVESIRRYYPKLRIIVADSGNLPAVFDDPLLEYHTLPHDAGVSAARNLLVEKCRTPYLFIGEDDYVFTEETDLAAFVDVLNSDPEVGIVGGPLHYSRNDKVDDFCCDFDVFRGHLHVKAGCGPWRATAAGVSYRLCDMTFNFMAGRVECFKEHPWRNDIPIGEHFGYFVDVWKGRRWRVAWTPRVLADHDHNYERRPEYDDFRNRARDFNRKVDKLNGFTGHSSDPAVSLIDTHPGRQPATPDVVVLGVGHSGTTILTKILQLLGWSRGDADAGYAESVSVRRLNDAALKHGCLNTSAAAQAWNNFPRPRLVKDPRFVQTLHLWLPVWVSSEPTLILIERDAAAVRGSYERRGEQVRGGLTVEQAQAKAREQYERWPWSKKMVSYEDLTCAITLWHHDNRAYDTPRDA
jgi:hypothetical protein